MFKTTSITIFLLALCFGLILGNSIEKSAPEVTPRAPIVLPECPGETYKSDRLGCFLFWKLLIGRNGRSMNATSGRNIPFREGFNSDDFNNVMG